MPTYVYECENCQHSFELIQRMSDKSKKRCCKCKKHKLFKVVQPFHAYVPGSSNTVGIIMDRNAEKMGHYEREERVAKAQAEDPVFQKKAERKKKAPWWRPGTSEPKKAITKMVEKAPIKQTPDGPMVEMTPELKKYIHDR